jgi:hypothetical protein
VINHTIPEDEKAYLHRVGRTGRAGKTGIAVTFVDWDDMHKWTLINNALDFGQPVPVETYSSSPHLYSDLNIPVGAKGRLRVSPVREHAASTGHSDSGRSDGRSDGRSGGAGRTGGAGRSGGSGRGGDGARADSGRTADAGRSGAARTRTRVSQATNPDAPAVIPAAGTHDGGGAQHHDGNSAPRRRSRSRRSAPAAGAN